MKFRFVLMLSLLPVLPEKGSAANDTDPEGRSLGGPDILLKGPKKHFTGFNGAEISNILASLSVGPYGPIAFWDNILLEKLGHLVRERIPERSTGARGNGAFGFFECTYNDLGELTKADFLSQRGKITKVAVRFAVGFGRIRTPEMIRTAHGFSVKFYTDEGNYDLLTTSFPVFTTRDAMRLPDVNHAFGPRPQDDLMDPNMEFDFVQSNPEALHRHLFIYSEDGIPDGWRRLTGWSVNTFKFVNSKNEYTYVRFTLEPLQKKKWLTDDEAAYLRGNEPDYFSRDLIGAIESGKYPKWTLKAQLLEPKKSKNLKFNPFDATKLWDRKKFPYISLGQLTLDKTASNWFSQIEQLAFDPSNLVPGIEPTLDKVLQGRLFGYRDAQNYRLGANYFKLTVNRPKVPLNQPHIRDGLCADYENGGPDPNYYPNTFGKTRDSRKQTISPFLFGEEELRRYNSLDEDNYSQVNETWLSFSPEEQSRIALRLAAQLVRTKEVIQRAYLDEVEKVNVDLAAKIKNSLGKISKNLSDKIIDGVNIDAVRAYHSSSM